MAGRGGVGQLRQIRVANQTSRPLRTGHGRAGCGSVAEVAVVAALHIAHQATGIVAGSDNRSGGTPVARQGAAAGGIAYQATGVLPGTRGVHHIARGTQVVGGVGIDRGVRKAPDREATCHAADVKAITGHVQI